LRNRVMIGHNAVVLKYVVAAAPTWKMRRMVTSVIFPHSGIRRYILSQGSQTLLARSVLSDEAGSFCFVVKFKRGV